MQIFQKSSGDGEGGSCTKENVPSKTQKLGIRTGRKGFRPVKNSATWKHLSAIYKTSVSWNFYFRNLFIRITPSIGEWRCPLKPILRLKKDSKEFLLCTYSTKIPTFSEMLTTTKVNSILMITIHWDYKKDQKNKFHVFVTP